MVKQGFINLSKDEQERVLEAALDEFSQKDFESASINKIIQKAGISKGSMYHYFQNKEDLYMHILDNIMEEKKKFLGAALQKLDRPVQELNFFKILTMQLEVSIQFAKENYRYYLINNHLQNMPESQLKTRIWERFHIAFDQYIATIVDNAIAAGEIRDDLGREFVIRILGFVLLNFTDISPNYREMLRKGDDVILQEMHHLVDFLKFGLCGSATKGEDK